MSIPLKTLFILAAGLMARVAVAQVDVNCRLDMSKTLRFEPVYAEVFIANNATEPLELPDGPGGARLLFDIEQTPSVYLPWNGTPLLKDKLIIGPRQEARVRVNLLPAYGLREYGPYAVRARLEWRGAAYLSPKQFLDVVPGLEIAQLRAGVPNRSGAARIYRLKTLNRNKLDRLLLCIEDEDAGLSYGVYDIGRVIRMFKPVLKVDAAGNIHVLHQAGPWRFSHCVFTPDGVLVTHDHYKGEVETAALKDLPDGTVEVAGATLIENPAAADAPPPDRAAPLGPPPNQPVD